MPEGLPETVQDLLRNMLRRNAAERYSVHQAQSHRLHVHLVLMLEHVLRELVRFMKKPPARTETKVELPCSEDNPHGCRPIFVFFLSLYIYLSIYASICVCVCSLGMQPAAWRRSWTSTTAFCKTVLLCYQIAGSWSSCVHRICF